jgi:hypothetical protein
MAIVASATDATRQDQLNPRRRKAGRGMMPAARTGYVPRVWHAFLTAEPELYVCAPPPSVCAAAGTGPLPSAA